MAVMGERESHSATVTLSRPTRRARGAVAATVWGLLAPLAAVAVGKLVDPGGGPPPFALLVLLGVAFPGIAAGLSWGRRGEGEVRARIANRSLLLGEGGNERVLRRDEIVSAFVSEQDNGRQRLELELADDERLLLDYPAGEAQRALAALALDPAHHATRIPLYGPNASVYHAVSGVFLGMVLWAMAGSIVHDLSPRGFFSTALGTAIALVTTLPFLLGGYAFLRRALDHVVIGGEGVEVSYASGFARVRQRHLPFAEMVRVSVETEAIGRAPVTRVVAHMDDGEKVAIGHYPGAPSGTRDATTLRDAIDAARVRFAKGEAPEALTWLEASRGGSWLAGLRDVARAEGSYRGLAITRERLLELLDDPRVAPRHRLAAAFVLKERNDEEGIRRVRVAADTTASPRVRVALASIAEGTAEDAALAEAAEDGEAHAERGTGER